MADVKISGLPASTTPLAGTEVLPIVQSGVTKQVSVANLTAGRIVDASKVTVNSNAVPYTIFSTGLPFVIVSSGSMGNNGALTFTGAVASAYPSAYVYLPAGAISSGSAAGFYYAVFSTTTAATVYNNTYTPSNTPPTIPASPTAFVTTGPGAYTQNGIGILTFNVSVPANTLTVNGKIDVDAFSTQTGNSALLQLLVNGSMSTQSNAATTYQGTKWKISARGGATGLMQYIEATNGAYNTVTAYSTDSLASSITIGIYPRTLTVSNTSVTLESFIVKIYS
jgi:hypothetical protein